MNLMRHKRIGIPEFVALVHSCECRVRAFVAAVTPRVVDELDDVVQDAFLVAWMKYEQFCYSGDGAEGEFTSWVCTIARYQAQSRIRERSACRLAYDSDLIDRLPLAGRELRSSFGSSLSDLAACVDGFTERDKRMLELRYEQGCTVTEIGRQYQLSGSAVYKALDRIRRRLESALNWEDQVL
jgi:RNA polymerase sigma-70 factor (ECF subfamily)